MKPTLLLCFVTFFCINSYSQTYDTTTTGYDFNSLTIGNLNGQNGWITTRFPNANTQDAVIFADTNAYNGTNCVMFNYSGANIGLSGSHKLDTIFGNAAFTDFGAKYVITFQARRSYWGVHFGIGADLNNNGKMDKNSATEQALVYKTSSQAVTDKFVNPLGITTSANGLTTSAWSTVEITLYNLRTGTGSVDVRCKSNVTGTWTNVVTAAALGIDTTATDKKNPALWDLMYFHMEGATGYLDNISFQKIVPIALATSIIIDKPISTVKVYPNPVKGLLNVQRSTLETVPSIVTISDILGNEVLHETITQQNSELNIEHLTKGIYFYQISDSSAQLKAGKLVVE